MIRLSKSSIGNAEIEAVAGTLLSEHLGMGEEVRKFESYLTEFVGRDSLCVVNGTAALHLALQAIGIGPGDEVIVPSLTYVASFQAIAAAGGTPVACDINELTLLADPVDVERRITKKTKAIMPVHFAGAACDMDALLELAGNHSLRTIEDAAHAFGSTYKGQSIGSFGDITCFSFDGIKNITSGEGGCVVSSDSDVLSYIKDARLLGVHGDSDRRYSGERSWSFDVTIQGWRYHMSNIMATIGLVQLSRFSSFAQKRRQLSSAYCELLRGVPEITLLREDFDSVVPHIFPVLLPPSADRDHIRAKMLDLGVETGAHYFPNHLLTKFSSSDRSQLPVTERVFPRLLSLPLHTDLEAADLEFIVNCLKISV